MSKMSRRLMMLVFVMASCMNSDKIVGATKSKNLHTRIDDEEDEEDEEPEQRRLFSNLFENELREVDDDFVPQKNDPKWAHLAAQNFQINQQIQASPGSCLQIASCSSTSILPVNLLLMEVLVPLNSHAAFQVEHHHLLITLAVLGAIAGLPPAGNFVFDNTFSYRTQPFKLTEDSSEFIVIISARKDATTWVTVKQPRLLKLLCYMAFIELATWMHQSKVQGMTAKLVTKQALKEGAEFLLPKMYRSLNGAPVAELIDAEGPMHIEMLKSHLNFEIPRVDLGPEQAERVRVTKFRSRKAVRGGEAEKSQQKTHLTRNNFQDEDDSVLMPIFPSEMHEGKFVSMRGYEFQWGPSSNFKPIS